MHMYEIELKAHIFDRETTIAKINAFAVFSKACQKTDTYWQHCKSGIQIRIREEIPLELIDKIPGITDIADSERHTIIATYKKKEIRTAQDNTSFEVNDEQEFAISAREPFETFLEDAGFTVSTRKLKTVYQWKADNCIIELCTVPPLGDFIEIEINAESNMPHIVSAAKTQLVETLRKCGIEKDCIESRFYSEMLEAQKRK